MASTGDAEAGGDQRLHEQVQDAVEHCGAGRGPQARLQDHARIVACGNEGRVDAGAQFQHCSSQWYGRG